jgi:hypothetical protein
VLCFAFLLVLMMNSKMTSYKPICLLKSPIAARTVIANGIPEMPGLPASARGTLVQLHRLIFALPWNFRWACRRYCTIYE